MKLEYLLKNADVKKIYNEKDADIIHITNDSRKCTEGSLFFAVRGYETDGHKYIKSAVKNGACAVICEEYVPDCDCTEIIVPDSRRAEALVSSTFYGDAHKKFSLIGITGTNGKTTVTYLVKHILEQMGKKVGLIGTNQNMIGKECFETGRTTPDSIELHKFFAKMAEEKVDYCIMEVSSHALFLDRVYGCKFKVGAFTNLTQDHLDFHKTMENYALAKSVLFNVSEYSVINSDDSFSDIMIKNASDKIITYSKNSKSDIFAENVKLSSSGVSFKIDNEIMNLSIPGDFSVYNGLCAIAVALLCGISLKEISECLKTANGVKGRCEVVPVNKEYTVIIDYAHTPDGIENILKTVKGFTKGRVIIVFGCGGDRDSTKRAVMGEIAGKEADFCVITSDNPRTEDSMKIISMIEEGVLKAKAQYKIVENRYEAIRYALNIAKKNDTVLLAGKGHETYQILNTGKIHFDEREAVREILYQENQKEV